MRCQPALGALRSQSCFSAPSCLAMNSGISGTAMLWPGATMGRRQHGVVKFGLFHSSAGASGNADSRACTNRNTRFRRNLELPGKRGVNLLGRTDMVYDLPRRMVMYSNPQRRNASDVLELRKVAGRWLKDRREACGLSQRQLCRQGRSGLLHVYFAGRNGPWTGSTG